MDNNNKPNTGASPANVGGKTVAENVAAKADELEAQYTDKRSITIAPVQQFSAYRRANIKSIGPKRNVIGSSINSTRILSSNKAEVEAYFPQIIGMSPNNPEFVTRVKAYLSNISFNVADAGSTLNTSFVYNHKKDYLAISKKEDAINAEYDKVDRANPSAIKEALKKKIDALNSLEGTKYLYGRPENLEEYLMYRHCLLYRDVAKPIS